MNVVQIQEKERIYIHTYNGTTLRTKRKHATHVHTTHGTTARRNSDITRVHGERKTGGSERARVYADGGGAANGMGTFTAGTDGIGGKATLGTTDGTTTAGIGGRVSLGSTDDGTAGIGGSATCGGTVTLGAAGMGGSVTCGTVTVGTAGMGGSATFGTVTAGTAGMGGSAATCGTVGTGCTVGKVGTAGRPGTAAAGAAAAAVVSAKWRAAWQVLVARRAHATTMDRKLAAKAILLAVARPSRLFPETACCTLVMLLLLEAGLFVAVLRRTGVKCVAIYSPYN